MMKRLIAVLLVASMACTAFACGKKEENGGNTTTVNTEISGTVEVGINGSRNSDFEALFEAFKERYPNVTVNPVLFETTSDDALNRLTAYKMADEKMPDVIFDDAGPIPSYIQNGWMYPLTEFVKDDAEFESIPQNLRDNYTYNGNIYALPQTIHSNMIIINEDLVEEMNVDLPEYDWTWDDFTDFVKACTNSSYSGIEDMTEAYNWMPGTMTEGASITGYEYETNTFNLEAVRKYVNYYKDLEKLNGVEGTSLTKQSASGKTDYEAKFGVTPGSDKGFIAGKIAGTFTGSWNFAKWSQKNLNFNWDLYPVPQCAEGRVPIHVDYCWMTTDVAEENVEAAFEFLKFVTYSKEGNIERLTSYDEEHITDSMKNEYYIPCTMNEDVVAKFKSLPNVTDAIIYIHENIGNGYLSDPEKTVPGFESVEYGVVGKIAYEAVTGRVDFSAKMAEAQTKANAEIKERAKLFEEALAKFEKDFAESHK